MKFGVLTCAVILGSSIAAHAQSTKYGGSINDAATFANARPVTLITTKSYRHGDTVQWNGRTIRYVKGTSREAGRQKFKWQE